MQDLGYVLVRNPASRFFHKFTDDIIGQQFALTSMSYTIVRILQQFERIDKYWPDSDAVLKSEILLSPANGVKVGFWAVTQSDKAI